MPGAGARPLEWLPAARRAFDGTLENIAGEDPETAELVRVRAEQAFETVRRYPGVGTQAPKRGERRFAVPRTGHVFHYRLVRGVIRIVLWYRARRDMVR